MSNNPSAKNSCKCNDPHQGRNLVVCIDGTSNKYGTQWTNVLELFSRLETEGQMRYYKNGIGAGDNSIHASSLVKVVDVMVDLAIAWNVEKGIQLAYHWLSERYKPGDRIFLFGFSRGAFQVRSLAAMIDAVGLVPEGHEEHIPYAYKLYMKLKTASQSEETTKELVETFKEKLSTANIQVHFVGVWDTVSSVGLIRGKKATLSDSFNHACIFRQALALDECRVKFQPECIAKNNPDPLPDNSKEVWFAGSHSEVGGVHSLVEKAAEMRNPALSWMQNEAILAGLLFKESSGEWDTNDLGKKSPERSLGGFWWILEYLPILRPNRENPDKTTRSLHRGRGRMVYIGQKIHASVAFCAADYVPKAGLGDDSDPTEWKDFVAKGLAGALAASPNWQSRIELDLFDVSAAPGLLESLANVKSRSEASEDVSLHTMKRLTFISGLRGGPKAIAASPNVKDALDQFLEFEEPSPPAATSSIPKAPLLFLATLRLIVRLVSSHSGTTSKTEAAKKVTELNSWGSEVLAQPVIYRAVVDLLSGGKTQTRVASAKTVTSLSTLDSCRKEIRNLDSGPIPSLVKMLGTRNESGPAVNALAALQETDYKGQLAPAMESLLKLLKGAENIVTTKGPGSSASAKGAESAASAANVLSLLAKDESARSKLVNSKVVIPALRKMLDGDGRSWGAASTTLTLLAHGQDDFSQVIKERNPVSRLVQSLGKENYNYGPTADELVATAPNVIARASMIKLGAITKLQQLLRTDNPGPATKALIKLAEYEETRRAICDDIAQLVVTLGESPGPAGGIFFILVGYDDSRSVLCTVVGKLVSMLTTESAESVAGVIVELFPYDDARRRIIESNAISDLLSIVYSDNPNDEAVDVLRELISWGGTEEIFLAEDGAHVKKLIGMLEGDHFQFAAEVLMQLTEFDETRKKILVEQYIFALIKLLESSAESHICARKCFEDLFGYDDGREQLIKSNAKAALAKVVNDKAPELREQATETVKLFETLNEDEEDTGMEDQGEDNDSEEEVKHSDDDMGFGLFD